MISEFANLDIDEINQLGMEINPNFMVLFHINCINNNEKIYVYKDNNNIIGFIHISVNYEVADLLNIVINLSNRNQGIGTKLFNYMIDNLPLNVNKIMLEVKSKNIEAINFYKKLNFKIINERKKYYDNDNALVMERIIK
jgi:[ribosomal protein S18]-alanine N-acetyltransferase